MLTAVWSTAETRWHNAKEFVFFKKHKNISPLIPLASIYANEVVSFGITYFPLMLRLHYVPGGHGSHDFGHLGRNGVTEHNVGERGPQT